MSDVEIVIFTIFGLVVLIILRDLGRRVKSLEGQISKIQRKIFHRYGADL